MKFEKIFRHGDVIIFRLPENNNPFTQQKTKEISKLTLALGEVTGHSHQLKGDLEVLEQTQNSPDEVFFRVKEKAVLTHEEHDAIVLDKGIYFKVNQVEFDPFEQIIRYVRD